MSLYEPPVRAPEHRPRAPARRGTIRLGRVAGVPVGVQPLWLVIVGLISWSLGAEYFPAEAPGIDPAAAYALGLASALLLFAGIVAHELGHALVARRHGVRIDEIDLWLLGGVARMHDEPREPGAELRFALAGPLVTLALLAVYAVAAATAGADAAPWLRAFIGYQVYVTAAILVLNLLPAFPLDGGRVLRALMWRRSGDQILATARAAAVGRVFGWSLVVLGGSSLALGFLGGFWTVFIGGFLILAGRMETEHLRLEHALAGRRAEELMTSPALVIAADTTIDEAIRLDFGRHLHRAFPVVDPAGRPVGMLALSDVRASSPDRRRSLTAGQLADRDPDLVIRPSAALGAVASSPGFRRAGSAAVVGPDGRVEGVLSRSDIERLLLAADLLDHPHQEAHHG